MKSSSGLGLTQIDMEWNDAHAQKSYGSYSIKLADQVALLVKCFATKTTWVTKMSPHPDFNGQCRNTPQIQDLARQEVCECSTSSYEVLSVVRVEIQS